MLLVEEASLFGYAATTWLAIYGRRYLQRISRLQFINRNRWPGTDLFQQISLRRFKLNEPAQHVEQVDEFGGLFREPMVGLHLAQL